MRREGLEPSESEDNGVTARSATNYGLSPPKHPVRDLNSRLLAENQVALPTSRTGLIPSMGFDPTIPNL